MSETNTPLLVSSDGSPLSSEAAPATPPTAMPETASEAASAATPEAPQPQGMPGPQLTAAGLKEQLARQEKQRVFHAKILRSLSSIAASQSPEWALGMAIAQGTVSSLVASETSELKAFGSMLIGLMAYVRTEGILLGRMAVINELLDHLREGLIGLSPGSTRRERERLIDILQSLEVDAHDRAPRTYEASFGSFVRDAENGVKHEGLEPAAPHLGAFLVQIQDRIHEAAAAARAAQAAEMKAAAAAEGQATTTSDAEAPPLEEQAAGAADAEAPPLEEQAAGAADAEAAPAAPPADPILRAD